MEDKETNSTMKLMLVTLTILIGGLGMAIYSWSWWSFAWIMGAIVLNVFVVSIFTKK